MKKFLIETINLFSPEERKETRLVPVRSQREAEKKAGPYQVVVSCQPYEGKAANLYIKECKERKEKRYDERNR